MNDNSDMEEVTEKNAEFENSDNLKKGSKFRSRDFSAKT